MKTSDFELQLNYEKDGRLLKLLFRYLKRIFEEASEQNEKQQGSTDKGICRNAGKIQQNPVETRKKDQERYVSFCQLATFFTEKLEIIFYTKSL